MKSKAHASLTEKAYQTLVHKIVTLELTPGSVLTESRLIHEMKIGRTPIREAIQRLIAEGLVTHLHHRGMLVAEIRAGSYAAEHTPAKKGPVSARKEKKKSERMKRVSKQRAFKQRQTR